MPKSDKGDNSAKYAIGIKLSINTQQNWKVQLQDAMYNYIYNDKIYFSLYANYSGITYRPNRANLIWKIGV